eukprot:TRINITY_DN5788_c0_g1_i4.p1 TRINITY_DN5788_c0_g1~~TRINITY_DN5788_c0_g1_i4.p1  ORF type:complete len:300 (-),score=56.59 TRINITY_DN5788_c0_g1_i4:91-990(-)
MTSVVAKLHQLVPSLSANLRKGSCGRVGVVGGCKEYTGAPYYAAMTAYTIGADLAYVFCTPDAAIPIKCYSPELIVLPTLDSSNSSDALSWIPRLHSIVIGPGLGRDEGVLSITRKIIECAKSEQKPMIIDGDGLFLLSQDLALVNGYRRAILTPNPVEFDRLWKAAFGTDPKEQSDLQSRIDQTITLSTKLGGVVILRKGLQDIIADDTRHYVCHEKGCPRRCGGQGDVIAGSAGIFAAWAVGLGVTDFGLLDAGLAACILTKASAESAFKKHFRATTTVEIMKEIGPTFQLLFPTSL